MTRFGVTISVGVSEGSGIALVSTLGDSPEVGTKGRFWQALWWAATGVFAGESSRFGGGKGILRTVPFAATVLFEPKVVFGVVGAEGHDDAMLSFFSHFFGRDPLAPEYYPKGAPNRHLLSGGDEAASGGPRGRRMLLRPVILASLVHRCKLTGSRKSRKIGENRFSIFA
jgi:hypothetical protein